MHVFLFGAHMITHMINTYFKVLYSVKRSDVTGNGFEWQLGENKVT